MDTAVITPVLDAPLRRAIRGTAGHAELIDSVFRIRQPHIEYKKSSCVFRLQDAATHELFAAKLLLPGRHDFRDYTTRRRRLGYLRECAARNRRFAPEGVCVGLRPIIRTEGDVIYCGTVADLHHLDKRFEYMWFMHLLRAGDSIEEGVQRNVAWMRPLALAVHDLHLRADSLSLQTAYEFASAGRVQAKLLRNLSFFEVALRRLKPTLPAGEWRALWPDVCSRQLAEAAEAISRDTLYVSAFDRRIAGGYIRKGHGDVKLKNIWFSDYYRSDIVRSFKDCITFFDAVDFDDTFCSIDTLSEAAMLAVDLQRQAGLASYATFLHAYLRRMHEWRSEDEMVFAYYMLEKAVVNTYVSALQDDDYASGRSSLWLVRIYLRQFLERAEWLRARRAAMPANVLS